MRFKIKILYYLIQVKLLKWLYRHNLAALRQKRFQKLLGDLPKSPFYASYSAKTSLEDFPVMDKSSFMSSFDKINTCGIALKEALHVAEQAENQRDFSPTINGITVGLSSGTSGNKGVFLASENERAQWVALVLDRVIGFSFRKRKVAFFLRANSNLYESVNSRSLSFHFFDLLKPLAEQGEKLDELNPNILVGPPSLLMELSKAVIEGKLNLSLDKIISVAEVLTPEDKYRLEKVFGQTIHQVYQCTEGFLAASCKEGRLHFNEDFLMIEKKYLGQEKTRFHPVITDLLRRSQPIIRYELNDIITEFKNCPCGNKMTAIDMIEGRADDILIFLNDLGEKVKIFPDFFRRAIIMSDSKIEDYALIQKGEKRLHLFVKSVNSTSFSAAEKAILKLLTNQNISNVEILAIPDKDHIKGNKLRRIRNDAK
jgi:putative adenylate-forming enzyme